MISESVIKECREYVAANEASAKEYLNRYFIIKEYSFQDLKATMLSEFLYIPVEDVDKTPGISYSKTTQLPPDTPTQSLETVVHLKWLKIPEHLNNLKCYRLAPRMFVTRPADKVFKEFPEDLKTEELTMAILPVFHFSSFLALMHRRFPATEEAIKKYERSKNLKELNRLVTKLQEQESGK